MAYGYNQPTQTVQQPISGNNNSGNLGQAIDTYNKVSGAVEHLSAAGNIAAGTAAAEAAEAAGTLTGGAAAAGAAGAAGAGITAAAEGTSLASLALLFYGGETVSQIKANKFHQVKVTGGSEGTKTSDEKVFYKNVHIPRKKV